MTSTATTIQFSAVNSSGWATGLWELYDYPPGYATPTGWTLGPSSIYYQASSSSPTPPVITQQAWGKIACRLTVNNGFDPTGAFNPARMIDTSCAVSMASPVSGLLDVHYGEGNVFGGFRAWVAALKTNFRLMESRFMGGTPIQQNVSTTITVSQLGVPIRVDTVAGGAAVTLTLPAITQAIDGAVLYVEDPNLAGSWGTYALTLTPTGAQIESPTTPATYGSTAVLNDSTRGGSIAYRANYLQSAWKKI